MKNTPNELESANKESISRSRPSSRWIMGLVIAGVLLAFGLRFGLVNDHVTHHHANFALYVNGQRDEFKNFTFYEEVAACAEENSSNPKSRVHMHNSVNSVVHVHDGGSTWEHFLANLGYTLGDSVLVTDDGTFISGVDGKKLQFVLNGSIVGNIANESIDSEDRLLIDYGLTIEDELMKRYETVASDADEYNTRPDPASCSGGSKETTKHRFLRTLGLDQSATADHGH